MATSAVLRHAKISAQKARLVTRQIAGLPVAKALDILNFAPQKAAGIVRKVLNSAISNAENNDAADIDELKVFRAFVDEGPTHKRIQPRARGRANRIFKQTSHITVIVAEDE